MIKMSIEFVKRVSFNKIYGTMRSKNKINGLSNNKSTITKMLNKMAILLAYHIPQTTNLFIFILIVFINLFICLDSNSKQVHQYFQIFE